MQEIIYPGEHLLPGQIGHFFIILSFVGLFFSIFSYYRQTKSAELTSSWYKLGRVGFYIHSFCLLGILAMLFYVMKNQMYEYQYVQAHVSDDLPMKYILSAFWEGQEGSFLLWMFWHMVMGLLLIKSAKNWEAPVMVVLGLVQLFIHSMILGLHIEFGDFSYKIGSNPTLLLRQVMDAPIFNNPDYVGMIKGTGLNPLLQNFWMTIHPPTIFFGFASVTIPFAFAVAGFWKRDYKGWIKPAMNWSLVSGTMLGLGIFMGCVWAYIALTFGGYWAWDPVENMSLVPWLFMIGGMHSLLIAKSTGYSIKGAYIMFSFSFVTLLYSTFLTRSGVLGDTSVHAFTEMGLEWQLVSFIVFFLAMALWFYFSRMKDTVSPKKEESIYSKEFWMQIGVLVLFFSSALITASTSLPVYNKIMEFFDPTFVGKVIADPVAHHNKFQLWVAVFIAVLSAKSLYLRFGEFNIANRFKKFVVYNLVFSALAGILTFIMSKYINLFAWQYMVLSFACFYSLTANIYYLFLDAKFQPKRITTVMAHAGFGLMILGSIASGLNKSVISTNPFGQKGLMDDDQLGEAVKLIKGKPFFVKEYWLTYERDTTINNERFFQVKFDKVDKEGNLEESFTLLPNVMYTNDYTKVAAQNPATKHYLGSDVFTYIAGLPGAQMDIKVAKEEEDSLQYVSYEMQIGDTLHIANSILELKGTTFDPSHPDFDHEESDFAIGAMVEFYNKKDSQTIKAQPVVSLNENLLFKYPEMINDLNLKIRLNDTLVERMINMENEMNFDVITLQKGQSKTQNGITLKLLKLSEPTGHKNYTHKEGDIPVEATLEVTYEGRSEIVKPLYIIRGSRPFGIKEYLAENGIHIRFSHINPGTETFEFRVAKDNRDNISIPIEIAENVGRKDIIVLSAYRFPGINLFWLGCSLMIFGLFFAFLINMKNKYA